MKIDRAGEEMEECERRRGMKRRISQRTAELFLFIPICSDAFCLSSTAE